MKTVDNDFATFVQTNWSLVEPSRLIWTPHMQIICDAFQDVVEGKNNRLIVNVPHGTSKSLLAAVFLPAWIQKVAGGRIGIVSDCRELAHRDLMRSGQIVSNQPTMQTHFGSMGWFSVDSVTTAQRFDMLILDVSNGPRNRKGWVDDAEIVWKTRLYDTDKSKVILIETRSEHGDVTGRLLAKAAKDEWRHICLPMAYDARVAKEDFRTEEGQLLCPERYDAGYVGTRHYELPRQSWEAQYQQRGGFVTVDEHDARYRKAPVEPITGVSVTPMYPTDYAKHIADVAKRYKQGDLSVEPDVRELLWHLEFFANVLKLEPPTQSGGTE